MIRRIWSVATLAGIGFTAATGFADPPVIQSVEVRGERGHAEIAVRGDFADPTYAVRTSDEGRTLVLEVANAALPSGGLTTTGEAGLVTRTTASTTAQGVRIELALSQAVRHQVRTGEGRILVAIDVAASPARAGTSATVRDVFIERHDGAERVVIELDRPAEFAVRHAGEGPVRLAISGSRLAGDLRRFRSGSENALIRQVRVRTEGDVALIEVDSARGATGRAQREGNRIYWAFNEGNGPRSRTVAREDDISVDSPEVAAFVSDSALQVRSVGGNRRYSGRRVDLDFKDADIHNILRFLAEFGGVNIVTTDDVSGSVTVRMENVPWDQALEVILQAKSLGMVRQGNLIRVAPAETLQAEAEAAIARARAAVELSPIETRIIPVSYADATQLAARVGEMLSSRGSVSTDERTNSLIVRDVSGSIDDVEELVRSLDTQTPQVLIEARIVEATSLYSRDVGIQWGGDVSMSSANGNPTGLAFPNNVGLAGGAYDNQAPTAGLSPYTRTVATPNYLVNLPAITGTGAGGALGIALGSVGGNVNLNVRLSAAESNGTVRIISSPRILTLTNHEAHIAQGTMIPYSQVSAQGVNTAFQEAKLELRVTPHVTSDGSVQMEVHITRDEPDFSRTSTRGDPAILKREAETTLLIADGSTAVIGGIYTRNTGRNVEQVPFFGDIPVLGVLFQRRRVRDERSELLIFLTPRIVNRSEALPE